MNDLQNTKMQLVTEVLQLIQMGEMDVARGKVMSVDQARASITKARRKRTDASTRNGSPLSRG
ncbi:MAG: hypothetical protein FGM32_04695 [Candidatus Kapabacteria bacterium]|nr:hypothetical protein [Candidatus Kapabacteria bacterium]